SLTCPHCSWGLHPKVSRYGVRFFCHDPERPGSYELLNESWEHHLLKLEMAGAIRAAGWFRAVRVWAVRRAQLRKLPWAARLSA
ncbi:competence protein CoiA family protein, partial [Streptomyces sp. NPDC001948]